MLSYATYLYCLSTIFATWWERIALRQIGATEIWIVTLLHKITGNKVEAGYVNFSKILPHQYTLNFSCIVFSFLLSVVSCDLEQPWMIDHHIIQVIIMMIKWKIIIMLVPLLDDGFHCSTHVLKQVCMHLDQTFYVYM